MATSRLAELQKSPSGSMIFLTAFYCRTYTSASMYAAESIVTRWLSRVLVTPPDRISPPGLRLCGAVRGLPHTKSIGSPKYVRMGSYLVSDAYHGFGDNHLKKKKKKRLYRYGGRSSTSPSPASRSLRGWAGWGYSDWWLRSGYMRVVVVMHIVLTLLYIQIESPSPPR